MRRAFRLTRQKGRAISLLIPCHRVVGTGGSLTGYAGGIDKNLRLLELEQADTSRLFVPKKSRSF